MRFTYGELLRPVLENPQGELVEGQFTCQRDDCWENVFEARYLEEVNVLTWICPKQHISKIKDFE